jgi:twitching motility two-component system response regulator PilG
MSKKILVADDSPTIRKLAESLLQKQGYQVLCAEDGVSALSLAIANKPDLIFWDDSLPIFDGHRICQELKENDLLKDTPVIILLNKDQTEKKEELKRSGADAFLVKPFNPKDILEKVQEFLNREAIDSKDGLRKGSKDELVPILEKHGIDKKERGYSLSKKDEKADGTLEILETSDFLESLEAPSSDSDAEEPHGFEWFMTELKKETEEAKEAELKVKPGTKEKLNSRESTAFGLEDSKKEDKKEKKVKVYEIDKNQKGYEDVLDELKRKLEQSDESMGPEAEALPDQKISSIDYDKMIERLIETISTKIAQEVAKKIDPEVLKQMIRDEVEKFGKEGIKVH